MKARKKIYLLFGIFPKRFHYFTLVAVVSLAAGFIALSVRPSYSGLNDGPFIGSEIGGKGKVYGFPFVLYNQKFGLLFDGLLVDIFCWYFSMLVLVSNIERLIQYCNDSSASDDDG